MKRFLAFLLSILLLNASAALAETVQPAQWINSDIAGNVTEETETDPREDLHIAVNKEWLVSTPIPDGKSQVNTFIQVNDDVKAQLIALLSGPMQEGHDACQAQIFYQQYVDMDERNRLGVEPILPYLQEIEAVSSLDELSAYLESNNPLSLGLAPWGIMADLKDSSQSAVYLSATSFFLTDADEYKSMTDLGRRKKQALDAYLLGLFQLFGYDQSAAEELVQKTFALETELASAAMGSGDQKQENYISRIYNPVAIDELDGLSPRYPIRRVLRQMVDAGIDNIIVMDTGWLAKLNELYTEENLESFKALLLCRVASVGGELLNQACIDLTDAYNTTLYGTEIRANVQEDAYATTSMLLAMAVGRLYADNFGSADTKAEIEKIIGQVLEVYKGRICSADWLSQATRDKALEKLDKLRVRVCYPDDWSLYDYSPLTLQTSAEGGSLLDSVQAIRKYLVDEQLKELGKPVNKDKWGVSPQTVNAFYNPLDNSINIPQGILHGDLYAADMSYAQVLGSIGMVIGHEITHGFDSSGSQYDADGNLSNWWTEADRAAFNARTQKVKDYYGSIQVLPGQNVDGQLTVTEAVADLGGMSCMLEIARNTKDFDYEAFFAAFARVWKNQITAEVQQVNLTDSHPPYYLRTNVNVQQFEEFYQTYGVQPGNGMYLAPESRLSVW